MKLKFSYPYMIPQMLLAEKVCKTISMDKIFYQNSGTEANEAMIKMARKYGVETYGPNRYHIVTAKMGFHGRTFGSMSATGQPENGCQIGFGPMTYGFSYAPYNDLEAFQNACTENTIAIMIELVQGEGGVHPATMEFATGLRKFCDEHQMLLLIDEVQTGWCRTGAVMSYMNYGIKPDIVSMTKALGGGMPIGAICATKEVAKAFTAGSHRSTFGGHPVSCAAALAEGTTIAGKGVKGQERGNFSKYADLTTRAMHVQEKIIRKLAERESCVIIGRSSDYILKDRSDLLRIFVYSPDEVRIKNIMESHQLSEADAKILLLEKDKRYHKRHYAMTGSNRGDRHNRDLLINSNLLGIDGSAKMIEQADEQVFG